MVRFKFSEIFLITRYNEQLLPPQHLSKPAVFLSLALSPCLSCSLSLSNTKRYADIVSLFLSKALVMLQALTHACTRIHTHAWENLLPVWFFSGSWLLRIIVSCIDLSKIRQVKRWTKYCSWCFHNEQSVYQYKPSKLHKNESARDILTRKSTTFILS